MTNVDRTHFFSAPKVRVTPQCSFQREQVEYDCVGLHSGCVRVRHVNFIILFVHFSYHVVTQHDGRTVFGDNCTITIRVVVLYG